MDVKILFFICKKIFILKNQYIFTTEKKNKDKNKIKDLLSESVLSAYTF